MAGLAVKLATLIIVVVSVYLDVCQACGECGTPAYKPPKTPKPPKKPPMMPPKTPNMPPMVPGTPLRPPVCPVALAELSVCSPLLGGVVGGLLPPSNGCCALLGLLGVDVEVCLCLALDANILGLISIHAKVDAVVTILTSCGYKVPPHFFCPVY